MLFRLTPLLIALLAQAITPAYAGTEKLPKPFSATYKAQYSGFNITATRSLHKTEHQTMALTFKANSWIAQIKEESQFQWGAHGYQIPQHYLYTRTGLGKDRHAELTFDWQKKRVTNNVQGSKWKMKLPDIALDKLGYQLQLRKDLINNTPINEYKIADGGRIKTYQFAILERQPLETPLGKLNTIKVKRIREDSKRTTNIWFAEDWDYLIVKLQHTEKNGKAYEINVSSATIEHQPVSGL